MDDEMDVRVLAVQFPALSPKMRIHLILLHRNAVRLNGNLLLQVGDEASRMTEHLYWQLTSSTSFVMHGARSIVQRPSQAAKPLPKRTRNPLHVLLADANSRGWK